MADSARTTSRARQVVQMILKRAFSTVPPAVARAIARPGDVRSLRPPRYCTLFARECHPRRGSGLWRWGDGMFSRRARPPRRWTFQHGEQARRLDVLGKLAREGYSS